MQYYAAPGVISKQYTPIEMTHDARVQYAESIIKTVATFYGVEMSEIYGKKREWNIPKACKIATYIIREKMPILTLKEVASLFGVRYTLHTGKYDHSSIIYNTKVVKGWIKVNDKITVDIDNILLII